MKKKQLAILSFYTYFTHVHHKWKSFNVWFLRYGARQTGFTSLTWKIKILKKWKKMSGEIIILQMYTINHNHMMYSSWDMERDRQNFLSFWTGFCPFIPQRSKKSKFWKNEKKPLEISLLYTRLPKITIIRYTVPEILHVTDVFLFFILGYFLPFYPPNGPKKSKF